MKRHFRDSDAFPPPKRPALFTKPALGRKALTHKAKRPQAVPVTRQDALEFEALLATAHALADLAGAVILPHFRTEQAIDHKGGNLFDPVTAADRDAESAIRAKIAELYPSHGIIGEEFGTQNREADHCWVIDPIDGTRSFILGLPIWGTLIGLTRGDSPLLGLMDQPFTGERFWSGEKESFFRRNGETKAIRARACPSLDQALLATTSTDYFTAEEESRFAALTETVRLRRFGGDCYNYCLLAMGHIDLVAEAGLKPFDILPLIPIIEGAGGVVSDWTGGDPRAGGCILAAGDPRVHAGAVEILSGARAA
jgi:histidinol phosphatase-like enzyme (inositol monophosphatase family)